MLPTFRCRPRYELLVAVLPALVGCLVIEKSTLCPSVAASEATTPGQSEVTPGSSCLGEKDPGAGEDPAGDLKSPAPADHRTIELPGRLWEKMKGVLPATVDALRQALRLPHREQRLWAVHSLAGLGASTKGVVPGLQTALYDSADNIRAAARDALHRIAPDEIAWPCIAPEVKPTILSKLVTETKSPDHQTRRWAIETLGTLGPDAKAGHSALGAALLGCVKSRTAEERRWAVEMFHRLSAETRAGLLDDWVETLHVAVRVERRAAAEMLVILGSEAKKAGPALRDALNHTLSTGEERERRWATGLLAQLGPPPSSTGPETVGALLGTLRSPDREARLRAAEALRNLGPDASAAVPALLTALEDSAQEVRVAARAALKKIDPVAATKAGMP